MLPKSIHVLRSVALPQTIVGVSASNRFHTATNVATRSFSQERLVEAGAKLVDLPSSDYVAMMRCAKTGKTGLKALLSAPVTSRLFPPVESAENLSKTIQRSKHAISLMAKPLQPFETKLVQLDPLQSSSKRVMAMSIPFIRRMAAALASIEEYSSLPKRTRIELITFALPSALHWSGAFSFNPQEGTWLLPAADGRNIVIKADVVKEIFRREGEYFHFFDSYMAYYTQFHSSIKEKIGGEHETAYWAMLMTDFLSISRLSASAKKKYGPLVIAGHFRWLQCLEEYLQAKCGDSNRELFNFCCAKMEETQVLDRFMERTQAKAPLSISEALVAC